ncbi:O-antigen ligase family protein [Patescibacteria group bacterium]|nr:O-antigen ligase family protein [Patescibacteria group bacterium]
MINSRLEKVFLNIIKIGVVLILFLPLLVYRPVLYPYVFSKILSFQVIVEIIFVFWLFLFLYAKDRGKYRLYPVKSCKAGSPMAKFNRAGWKNPLVIALTAFMGILFLTSLIGVDFAKSFWSTQERMTGVITLLHFYAFFIILISILKSKKDWQNVIWLSLVCSVLVGVYGIGQKFGLEFLLKDSATRMSATLGNPDFLGVYAMVHIFLAGFLLHANSASSHSSLRSSHSDNANAPMRIFKKRRFIQVLIGLLLLFNLSVLFLTGTRGAFVGFGASIIFGLIYFIFSRHFRRRGRILSLILLLIIVGSSSFIYFNKNQEWMKKAPIVIRRLTSISLESNKARLVSWQIGLQGFKQKPIFGYGWENYDIVFNKNYNPWYLRTGDAVTWFDRSHNQVIDILALTGIFGILSYLAIFGAVFWLLRRKATPITNDTRMTRIGLVILALMFLAYFIQNLFVFDTPAPLIVFYFSLALVYFVTQCDTNILMHANNTNEKQSTINNQQSTISRFPLPVLILLIIIFLPWAMYKFNIEPFQQSRLGIKAIHTSNVDLKSGLYWYEQALTKPCFTNPEVRVYLAKTVSEQYSKINEETTLLELNLIAEATEMAIAEYKKSVQEHPLNARHWLYLGQLYSLGVGYEKEYIQKADEALHKALELSPKRQQVYFELARVQLFLQEYEKAIELLKQAVILDPEVRASRQNLEKVLKTLKEQNPELVKETQQFLKEIQ